jgi:hypothetical protein
MQQSDDPLPVERNPQNKNINKNKNKNKNKNSTKNSHSGSVVEVEACTSQLIA